MILLKKPYLPLVFTGAPSTFNVYGKSFKQIDSVYISGDPVENTSLQNPFSAVPRLSSIFPAFTAYKLLSTEYTTNFDNTITITLPAFETCGYVDIIVQNIAGYGALTQFVVKEMYSNEQSLARLRPWSRGVGVFLSGSESNVVDTEDDFLITEDGDYIIQM